MRGNVTVGACWVSKLKAQVKLSASVFNLEIKTCLAITSGPDLHNFVEAAEEECLLCVAEGGVHGLGMGKVYEMIVFISKWRPWQSLEPTAE